MSRYVQCDLCPKMCIIPEGHSGDCRIRVNIGGVLKATTYGRPCAVHIDPIEKKPLFHFYPGTPILSIATAGCNLHCKNCQNWQISQASATETTNYNAPPKSIVNAAIKEKCLSIAYTYTDPNVYYEYVYDTAVLAREKGIKNVLVTAGYINKEPLRKLAKWIDASTTDLKSFDDNFYRSNCDATLGPVLDALVVTKEEGIWLEVSNLVIPTLTDDPGMIRRMCQWHIKNLGADTPLHFLRFYPHYRLQNLPPTPVETIKEARDIARDVGLKYVYMGNVWGYRGEDTLCPEDGKVVIERDGFAIREYNLVNGKCRFCGTPISGRWDGLK